MEVESSLLEAAVKLSLVGARAYPTHSDPTRDVPGLTEEEREEIRQKQTAISAFDSTIEGNARAIIELIFAETKLSPASGRKPYHVNVAGALGVNEITLADFNDGELPGTYDFLQAVKGHVMQIGLGDVFRKMDRYDREDHMHTFPLVRGEASGILEAAKDLVIKLLFDVLANDSLNIGLNEVGRNKFKAYFDELSQTRNYVVIARALTPDEAWKLVQERGDLKRFGEEQVKKSAREFAESIDIIFEKSPNIVLLNAKDEVIYKQVDGQAMISDLEAVGEWKKQCGVETRAKIGAKGGRSLGGAPRDPLEIDGLDTSSD